MAVSIKLQTRQTQSLVMTPQLVQSIKLLQMNCAELQQHIEGEIEKNPFLEMADEMEGQRGQRERRGEIGEAAEKDADPIAVSGELDVSSSTIENKLDTSLENTFDADRSGGDAGSEQALTASQGEYQTSYAAGSGASHLSGGDSADLAEYVAEIVNLREHLSDQLQFLKIAPETKQVGLAIVDSLDEDGYFRRDMSRFCEQVGTNPEIFEAALKAVQGLEPCGVGARDLGECLKLQLIEQNRFDPAMEKLLENLDLLAKRDFKTLQTRCKVSQEDLIEMVEEIRALDPRPARAFDHAPVHAIIPDVIITTGPDGRFVIELNSDALPKVLVNQSYKAIVDNKLADEEQKAFVTDSLQSANWLVRSLEQRAETILKVVSEIVRRQDAFFAHGVRHLKPMSRKQVADEIKMHESTVSRIANNKYALTDRGMFELKYFFSAALPTTDGEDAHSAEAVRHHIRDLIEAETVDAVLSDDKIVEILAKQGIEIARRTIAKYREAMNIPSSVQRRREKKAGLQSV